MSLLALEQVGFSLQGRDILDGISTRLAGGELVALVGPNGAGKSTLLRVMAGIQACSRGRVILDGRALDECSPVDWARQRGYLAQSATVSWPVSVRHLVSLGRLPYRQFWQPWTRQDQQAVDAALVATDTLALAERAVTALSGGERMRVLMARVLAGEPRLLLADEPLAALDPLHQLQMMALFRAHCDGGGSAVVALHDLSLACRFCDRLWVIDQGRLVADGTPQAVIASGLLESVYRVRFGQVLLDGRQVLVVGDILGERDPV